MSVIEIGSLMLLEIIISCLLYMVIFYIGIKNYVDKKTNKRKEVNS